MKNKYIKRIIVSSLPWDQIRNETRSKGPPSQKSWGLDQNPEKIHTIGTIFVFFPKITHKWF